MRIRIGLTAVIMITLCRAALGGAVSGVSNTFGIDNTQGGAPAVSSYGQSPYGAGTVLLRGQLHAHRISDFSSYSISSDALALLYTSQGYDFLAQTEHHFKENYTAISPESVLGGWQGWAPNSVELTYGRLIPPVQNDTHVLAIGTSQGTSVHDLVCLTGNKVQDTIQRVKNVKSHSGLAYVAHPDSWPYNIGVDDLAKVVKSAGPNGIGIWTPANDSQRTWDKLVYELGKPVWGYVEDDYHPDSATKGNLGRTWVSVPGSPGEWWGNIKEKLRNGNYYCYYTTKGKWPGGSTPPQMRVTVSNSGAQPLISVNFDRAVSSIEFYGYDWGFFKKLKSPVSGSSDSYQANGREKFVRVMARYEFSGGTLWMTSQPIVINKNGNFSPYYSSGVGIMSASPELILQYMDTDNKPVAPAAGYVGDAFDVTTDTGQLPPGAILQLSYAGEDIAPLGGTQYLAIYRYDDPALQWIKVGGTVDPDTQTIESPISALGKYCISADLPADTTAPQVFIDNPPYAASVAADTMVKATVNDDLGAWRVKFYMNDHLLAEDASGEDGWSADLKIADYCTGDWTLRAVAEDLAGNSGSVEMPIYIASSTPPPTVTIVSPTSGSTLTGTITASGACGDDVAVDHVMLKLDDTVVGYADIDGGNWTCRIDTTPLADGARTLKAVVEDYPGNSAEAATPVAISNGAASALIGAMKQADDGSPARLNGGIVVADRSLVGDGFYVESANRSAGIKVVGDRSVSLGDAVNIVGIVATQDGEKAVTASDVAVASSGNQLPKPLATYGKVLLRRPDMIGKIVKVWGNMGQVDPSNPPQWFFLNDQSGVQIKCRLAPGIMVNSDWSLISVTGVVSSEQISGATQPIALIRQSGDIRPLVGN